MRASTRSLLWVRGARIDVAVVALLVILPTALHYVTPHDLAYLHGIFRRLYYLPIIYSALRLGLTGSVVTASVVTILYVPHAFLARFHDPGTTTEKVLEIVLYLVVAFVAGALVTRLRREVSRQREAARELEVALRERERMEVQLRVADRLAALGQLTAGLAHEIRNPLGTIKGAAQILSDYQGSDDPRREVTDLLVRESDHLDSVVERFLDFARPVAPRMSTVDLGMLVTQTAQMLRASQHGGAVRIVTSGCDDAVTTVADPTLIKQVFINMGLNALQAIEGEGELAIEVTRRPGHARVGFRDSGHGLDAETLKNLFNPFFTTRPRGVGLGLAVSHRIVQEHGGEIEVESDGRSGSVFTVVLPSPEGGHVPS